MWEMDGRWGTVRMLLKRRQARMPVVMVRRLYIVERPIRGRNVGGGIDMLVG